jgi:hypothetical protein
MAYEPRTLISAPATPLEALVAFVYRDHLVEAAAFVSHGNAEASTSGKLDDEFLSSILNKIMFLYSN